MRSGTLILPEVSCILAENLVRIQFKPHCFACEDGNIFEFELHKIEGAGVQQCSCLHLK
jgi:hypothetical protein